MTDREAHDLGLSSWAECSAHEVQDTSNYAAVASSSRGLAVAGAEMPLLNNPVADDLESDPGFVCNCGRMSAFEREYYRLNNIMPKRPLSAIFAVNQTSENEVKDIFQDLHNIGIHAHVVSCLQRVSNDRFCITFGKENYRNTFLKQFSFIPHFTNSRPQLSTSSNLVYVAAYDRPICKPVPSFSRLGVTLSARSTKIRLPPVINAIDLVIKLGCALIYFALVVKGLAYD